MDNYHGHRTMPDGSRVALSKDEAEAILKQIKVADANRAEAMPTVHDALDAVIEARQRMRELGWAPSGGLRVKRGDECAVAQIGSTGIWRGRVDSEGKYVHFGDSVAKPRDCWLKPLGELTTEERDWMDECDRREAAAFAAMLDRWSDQERDDG